MPVLFRLSNIEIELPEVEFHVLVSGSVLDIQLSSHHPHVKPRGFWDLNPNLEVVMRTSSQFKVTPISRRINAYPHVIALRMIGDSHNLIIRTYEFNSAGTEVHADLAPRRKFRLDRTLADFFDPDILRPSKCGSTEN